MQPCDYCSTELEERPTPGYGIHLHVCPECKAEYLEDSGGCDVVAGPCEAWKQDNKCRNAKSHGDLHELAKPDFSQPLGTRAARARNTEGAEE